LSGRKIADFRKRFSEYSLVHHHTKQCGTALSGLPVLAGEVPCHIGYCGRATRFYGFHHFVTSHNIIIIIS